jgi:hypothetical protein
MSSDRKLLFGAWAKARAVNFKPGRKTAWSLRPSEARMSRRCNTMGPRAKDELMIRLKWIGELKELRQFGDDD